MLSMFFGPSFSESAPPLETISAVKPDTQETSLVEVLQTKVIGSGAEGVIHRIVAKLEGENNPEVVLVHKVLKSPESAADLEENYKLAKEAGLPIPETFSVTSKGLLMSDLSENDANLVLSSNDLIRSKMSELESTRPDLINTFKRIDLGNLNQMIAEYSHLAAQNNITFINDDCWFFVMKPDGTYRLVLTDFSNMNKTRGDYQENRSSMDTLRIKLLAFQKDEEEETKPSWMR